MALIEGTHSAEYYETWPDDSNARTQECYARLARQSTQLHSPWATKETNLNEIIITRVKMLTTIPVMMTMRKETMVVVTTRAAMHNVIYTP